MACRIVAILITLSELEGHVPIAGPLKYDFHTAVQ